MIPLFSFLFHLFTLCLNHLLAWAYMFNLVSTHYLADTGHLTVSCASTSCCPLVTSIGSTLLHQCTPNTCCNQNYHFIIYPPLSTNEELSSFEFVKRFLSGQISRLTLSTDRRSVSINIPSTRTDDMARGEPFSTVSACSTVQQKSKLLELPANVRTQIYTLVFTDLKTVIPPRGKRTNYGRSKPSGLLLACKPVHFEAVKLYYKTVTFYISSGAGHRLKEWTNKIGPARTSLLEDVHVTWDFGNIGCHDFDGDVRGIAQKAQQGLNSIQKPVKLNSGVLKSEVIFEGYRVWTASPLKLAEEALKATAHTIGTGRIWIDEPSEYLKHHLPFVHTL